MALYSTAPILLRTGNPTMTAIIIIVSVAFMALLFYLGIRSRNKLIDEGKIILRKSDFMRSAEIFTLDPPDPAAVVAAVKAFDYADMRVSMKGSSEKQQFAFTGSSWGAQLYKQDSDEKAKYRFEFTNWKSSDGSVKDETNMNKLLTAVEKMFIGFDPNTQVTTVPLELKTKHHLF
ncbi:MAG: hypothetical protein K6F68_04580 [Clostridiales bacterium]|nr:hypothetical protein [Clostridiales bacterium]